jgi:hypothetical protein
MKIVPYVTIHAIQSFNESQSFVMEAKQKWNAFFLSIQSNFLLSVSSFLNVNDVENFIFKFWKWRQIVSVVCFYYNFILNTYAHAYLDAFRLPVNNGDNSARNLMSVLTLSASPAIRIRIEIKIKSKLIWF